MPQVILPDFKTGSGGSPMAWSTIFGWAIFGPFQSNKSKHRTVNVSVNHYAHEEAPADQILKQFWKVEEVSTTSKALTPEEEAVEQHYNLTYLYIPSQSRYQVKLPQKPAAPGLGESRTQALQQFCSNEASVIR